MQEEEKRGQPIQKGGEIVCDPFIFRPNSALRNMLLGCCASRKERESSLKKKRTPSRHTHKVSYYKEEEKH